MGFPRILSIDGLRVIVLGRPRLLPNDVREHVYRIGREALVNAFRHARATNIEVELEYAPRRLRVVVRDDGRGIDTRLLQSEKDKHWGLLGMRERSERIGGNLRIWSRHAAGTEVDRVFRIRTIIAIKLLGIRRKDFGRADLQSQPESRDEEFS